jgi:hypothetical protein
VGQPEADHPAVHRQRLGRAPARAEGPRGPLRDNKARIVEGAEALMDRVVTAMVGSAGDEALPAAA